MLKVMLYPEIDDVIKSCDTLEKAHAYIKELHKEINKDYQALHEMGFGFSNMKEVANHIENIENEVASMLVL